MRDASGVPPRWIRGTLLAYFFGLLPVLAWALWRLIDTNSRPDVPLAAGGLSAMTTAQDSIGFLVAAAQSPLRFSQGDLVLAVMLAGALGSYIHGATSFVTFLGNDRFRASWVPWYVLRPMMGVAMALVFYLVVRGGVLVMSGGVSSVDPYAMMTVAALAGMFSKQASDKLAEVFDTLFRSRADDERRDKLQASVPRITSLEPASVLVGQPATVTVRGSGFDDGSRVRVDGTDRTTTFTNPAALTFELLGADVESEGERQVQVFNPGPGGGLSHTLPLSVSAAKVQVPSIVGADGPVATGAGGDEAEEAG